MGVVGVDLVQEGIVVGIAANDRANCDYRVDITTVGKLVRGQR